jgi:transcriptional regulator EpsA
MNPYLHGGGEKAKDAKQAQGAEDGASGLSELTVQQAEALVSVIESSPFLTRRSQFFIWTQGQFQTLLPHVAMACAGYLRQRRDLVFDVFNSIVLPSLVTRALTDTQGPLMRLLIKTWISGKALPVVVRVDHLLTADVLDVQAALRRLGMHALLVHGVARPARPEELESFFVLMCADAESTACAREHMDYLMPHLHWSWQRVLAAERELAAPRSSLQSTAPATKVLGGKGVTAREKQILSWVREGKSNHEIADILSLSPLTVKNHIQKILRKMGCSNRAQAVAEAIAMGLVPGASIR